MKLYSALVKKEWKELLVQKNCAFSIHIYALSCCFECVEKRSNVSSG